MQRLPSQKRSRETVERLVDAGFVALSRHGPHETTTRRIAAIAGMGVGSVYEYFGDKHEIFRAMWKRLLGDAVDMAREVRPRIAGLGVEEAMLEVLRSYRELLERNDRRYLLCARHSLDVGGIGQLQPLESVLHDLLLQYVIHRPELLRMPNLDTTAYLIVVSGVQTVVRHLSDPRSPVTFDQLSVAMARMVARYVEGEVQLGAAHPAPH